MLRQFLSGNRLDRAALDLPMEAKKAIVAKPIQSIIIRVADGLDSKEGDA
jgi:hypothetical protein